MLKGSGAVTLKSEIRRTYEKDFEIVTIKKKGDTKKITSNHNFVSIINSYYTSEVKYKDIIICFVHYVA